MSFENGLTRPVLRSTRDTSPGKPEASSSKRSVAKLSTGQLVACDSSETVRLHLEEVESESLADGWERRGQRGGIGRVMFAVHAPYINSSAFSV